MFFSTLISSVSNLNSPLFTTYASHWMDIWCTIPLWSIVLFFEQCLVQIDIRSSEFFYAKISAVLAYPKNVLLGIWPVTVLADPLQECLSAREISRRCLAVRRWSIKAPLAFKPATSNCVWMNTVSKKGTKTVRANIKNPKKIHKTEENNLLYILCISLAQECLWCVWQKC